MDIICIKCGKRMDMCSRCEPLSPHAVLGEVRAALIKEYNISQEEAGLLELSYREGLKRALQIIEEASIST